MRTSSPASGASLQTRSTPPHIFSRLLASSYTHSHSIAPSRTYPTASPPPSHHSPCPHLRRSHNFFVCLELWGPFLIPLFWCPRHCAKARVPGVVSLFLFSFPVRLAPPVKDSRAPFFLLLLQEFSHLHKAFLPSGAHMFQEVLVPYSTGQGLFVPDLLWPLRAVLDPLVVCWAVPEPIHRKSVHVLFYCCPVIQSPDDVVDQVLDIIQVVA